MVARVAFCLLLAQGQTQFPYPDVDIKRDIAETERFAYFLGPVKPVASGKVVQAEWSADDQTLAYQIQDDAGFSAYVWNRKSARASKVAASKGKIYLHFQNARTLWLDPTIPGPVAGPIMRYSVADGRLTRVFDGRGEGNFWVAPSYTSDEALIGCSEPAALFYYSNNQLREITLPKGVGNIQPEWDFGRPAVFLQAARTGGLPTAAAVGTQPSGIDGLFWVETATGAIGAPVGNAKVVTSNAVPPDLRLSSRRVRIGNNMINGFWLEESGYNPANFIQDPRTPSSVQQKAKNDTHLIGLVAADQTSARLSPTSTAVAYWDRHNLFVREIKSMPHDEFEKAFEEAEKQVLVDQAKQVGMGMRIYSSDADDLLPQNDGTLDRILPYLKDGSMIDGFQYVLGGQNTKDFKDPAGAVLGRIQGRFGRAIVFVDGHVIWERKRA